MTHGIVIIGAGYCGVSAALAVRDAGYSGPVTLIGDDPEWPYEKPPLSKWDGADPIRRPIVAPETYAENDIVLRRCERVLSLEPRDQRLSLQSGETLRYDRLLLATGASPRRIEPPVQSAPPFHYLRSFADAEALSGSINAGEDVVIIGGGFIGLELAASVIARKTFVHVLEAQERILARALPAEISAAVQTLHEANGVTIHTRSGIAHYQDKFVHLICGQTLRADHVIVGIGSTPNTDIAAQAGLLVDNGVVVDECFTTSDPNIFAAGDCCIAPIKDAGMVRQESWQIAGEQGTRVGQIIAGVKPIPAAPPWFWSDQFDHSLQVVGSSVPGGTKVLRQSSNGALLCIDLTPTGRITQAAGIGPGHSIGRDIKVIQRLIASRKQMTADQLADTGLSMKSLLRAGKAAT